MRKQPTNFALDVVASEELGRSHEAKLSLERYIATLDAPSPARDSPDIEQTASLFLRVTATADYFSLNATLMDDPEPVLVDLILDPYLGNVFPRSLTPVAAYLALVAAIAWVVSGRVWRLLSGIASGDDAVAESREKLKAS
ncbi:hypothetical protein KEM52_003042 [Ascosphaera acerosa]|nr:hypothetical protein KEM52_003042 [Ascosphaera acerosa]